MTLSEENYLKAIYHLTTVTDADVSTKCYCRNDGNQSFLSDRHAQEIGREKI